MDIVYTYEYGYTYTYEHIYTPKGALTRNKQARDNVGARMNQRNHSSSPFSPFLSLIILPPLSHSLPPYPQPLHSRITL